MTVRLAVAAALACVLPLGGCADANVPAMGEARLIKDLDSGSSNPGSFSGLGRIALFATATDAWRTDGTTAGTVPVSQAGPQFGPAGATRFFAGTDDAHGTELWKTDGTAAGTVLVRDINPGPGPVTGGPSRGSSYPREFTEAGGSVYFVACDGAHGWELWKTDGTEAGTSIVDDIDPSPVPPAFGGGDGCVSPSWRPHDLVEMNGRLYFLHDDSGDGVGGLWDSDGTSAGTSVVKEVPREQPTSPRDSGAPVANLTRAAGRLFFTTRSNLWTSNGSPQGTVALPHVPAAVVAGTPSLFFFLWEGGVGRSDGTAAGTFTVSDVPVPTDIRFNSQQTQVATAGDRLFFIAKDLALWTSDGTREGTVRVEGVSRASGNVSRPFSLTALEGSLYFVAQDGTRGRQLWRADSATGRATRLTEIAGQVAPDYDTRDDDAIGMAGGVVLFPARDAEHGTELWGYRTR